MNLAAGYDYNALILATRKAGSRTTRDTDMEDLYNPGLQGQFSVKFIF